MTAQLKSIGLKGTPYSLDPQAQTIIIEHIAHLEDRVKTLRDAKTLTQETLINYYGAKRFEHVAESNAIEGSTLSAGETELAVLKGMTTTGHDPAYIRDAISLDKALERLIELAKDRDATTDQSQLQELHALLMGDRQGAGIYRNEPVRIKGVEHKPPPSWQEVMSAMEEWESWSKNNKDAPAIIRATILHAWLAHTHPYIDGNGRAARAVTNLELVRAGYPPIIFRKRERERYIDALGESDKGGDINPLFELILQRADGAITGLETSAKNEQNYNPRTEKIKQRQQSNLQIWGTSVSVLAKTIEHHLAVLVKDIGGKVQIKEYESPLDLEDYNNLFNRQSVSKTWCFIVSLSIPSCDKLEILAYISYRSSDLYKHLNNTGGPAIYWSTKNPTGSPRWITDNNRAPFCAAMTTEAGVGDNWIVKLIDSSIKQFNTPTLATKIADALLELANK